MHYIDEKMKNFFMLNRIGKVTNCLFYEFERKKLGQEVKNLRRSIRVIKQNPEQNEEANRTFKIFRLNEINITLIPYAWNIANDIEDKYGKNAIEIASIPKVSSAILIKKKERDILYLKNTGTTKNDGNKMTLWDVYDLDDNCIEKECDAESIYQYLIENFD